MDDIGDVLDYGRNVEGVGNSEDGSYAINSAEQSQTYKSETVANTLLQQRMQTRITSRVLITNAGRTGKPYCTLFRCSNAYLNRIIEVIAAHVIATVFTYQNTKTSGAYASGGLKHRFGTKCCIKREVKEWGKRKTGIKPLFTVGALYRPCFLDSREVDDTANGASDERLKLGGDISAWSLEAIRAEVFVQDDGVNLAGGFV